MIHHMIQDAPDGGQHGREPLVAAELAPLPIAGRAADAAAPAGGSASQSDAGFARALHQEGSSSGIEWTVGTVFWTMGVFILAGLAGVCGGTHTHTHTHTHTCARTNTHAHTHTLLCRCRAAEIGGGWLVWQGVRCGKPWYYIVGGGLE
jgi:hypothetical protein